MFTLHSGLDLLLVSEGLLSRTGYIAIIIVRHSLPMTDFIVTAKGAQEFIGKITTTRSMCSVSDATNTVSATVRCSADVTNLEFATTAWRSISRRYLLQSSLKFTSHVIASRALVDAVLTVIAGANSGLFFNLLSASLLLLSDEEVEPAHAFIILCARFTRLDRHLMSCTVLMATRFADEDVASFTIVQLAVWTIGCDAVPKVWVVAKKLLKLQAIVTAYVSFGSQMSEDGELPFEHIGRSVLLYIRMRE